MVTKGCKQVVNRLWGNYVGGRSRRKLSARKLTAESAEIAETIKRIFAFSTLSAANAG
jgi:hypothetical protein